MTIFQDPEHPILQQAWQYEIIGINLDLDPEDAGESRLDLKVRKNHIVKIFRFWSPGDLEIERGGPRMTSGLGFRDVSSRGLENINVQVDDFECSWGAVRFVARDVEEITADQDNHLP